MSFDQKSQCACGAWGIHSCPLFSVNAPTPTKVESAGIYSCDCSECKPPPAPLRSQPLGLQLPYTPAQQRDITKADLLKKFQLEDWHGVMDCAADLREHDAYLKGYIAGESK